MTDAKRKRILQWVDTGTNRYVQPYNWLFWHWWRASE